MFSCVRGSGLRWGGRRGNKGEETALMAGKDIMRKIWKIYMWKCWMATYNLKHLFLIFKLKVSYMVFSFWPVFCNIHKKQLGRSTMSISATLFKMAGQCGNFQKPNYFSLWKHINLLEDTDKHYSVYIYSTTLSFFCNLKKLLTVPLFSFIPDNFLCISCT